MQSTNIRPQVSTPKQTLAELSVGERCIIKQIGNNKIKTRLMEIGLIEGTTIEVCNLAPWGQDPILIEFRGTRFALRKKTAKLIKVTLIPESLSETNSSYNYSATYVDKNMSYRCE